jgi:hypothetical protein
MKTPDSNMTLPSIGIWLAALMQPVISMQR